MADLITQLARNFAFPLIIGAGLERAVGGKKDEILILMYHGVNSTGDTTYNGRHISADRFERHLQYIKKHFEVLSLKDSYALIGTKRTGKPRVVITFDDGFENNLVYAAPLLAKYQLPATFFVSSVCVTEEADILWNDVFDMLSFGRKSLEVQGRLFEVSELGFRENSTGVLLQAFIKRQDCTERDAIIGELSDRYNLASIKKKISSEGWKLMNANQVKTLSEMPLQTIGSHCHFHYNMASLNDENAKRELSLSKSLLENCTQKPIDQIAFPDGSYDSRIKRMAYEAGYTGLSAVTFKEAQDADDRKIVKRSAVSSTTNYYSNVFHFHKYFAKHGN